MGKKVLDWFRKAQRRNRTEFDLSSIRQCCTNVRDNINICGNAKLEIETKILRCPGDRPATVGAGHG